MFFAGRAVTRLADRVEVRQKPELDTVRVREGVWMTFPRLLVDDAAAEVTWFDRSGTVVHALTLGPPTADLLAPQPSASPASDETPGGPGWTGYAPGPS